MKASDIPDEVALKAVLDTQGMHGVPNWSTVWDIQDKLNLFPQKVVLAKLRSLVRSKKISGCYCGCRGDFEIKGK